MTRLKSSALFKQSLTRVANLSTGHRSHVQLSLTDTHSKVFDSGDRPICRRKPLRAAAEQIGGLNTSRGRMLMLRARSRRVEALARMLAEKSKADRAEIANAVRILRDLRV